MVESYQYLPQSWRRFIWRQVSPTTTSGWRLTSDALARAIALLTRTSRANKINRFQNNGTAELYACSPTCVSLTCRADVADRFSPKSLKGSSLPAPFWIVSNLISRTSNPVHMDLCRDLLLTGMRWPTYYVMTHVACPVLNRKRLIDWKVGSNPGRYCTCRYANVIKLQIANISNGARQFQMLEVLRSLRKLVRLCRPLPKYTETAAAATVAAVVY